jgi:hypothetical protein
VLGRWEMDRGSQEFAYDFWWHLGHDTMVSSEWGTPDMVEDGLVPELLLISRYLTNTVYAGISNIEIALDINSYSKWLV